MKFVTCIAPVNIAVIKYWGKRDESLILPLNDSVSATLSTDHMCAKTTVMISPEFKSDRLWLNGREESCDNPRLQNCLKEIRGRKLEQDGSNLDICNWHIHICSENNFPTAAGLASSAAGYACLVFALSHLYELQCNISILARQGSGSACRSVFGGFVHWHRGIQDNGSDSLASQIVPASHWSEIRILIVVVSDTRKKTGSTSGMQRGVETSELLKYRVSDCVPRRITNILKAIEEKKFEEFAEIIMKDSNQLHAICIDTYPPVYYMNDTSHKIVEFVHSFNKFRGSTKLAYTFDAGPNAFLFMENSDIPLVISLFNYIFPPSENLDEYIKGLPFEKSPLLKDTMQLFSMEPQEKGLIKSLIHTQVGNGPQIVTDHNQHLLSEAGIPKSLNLE